VTPRICVSILPKNNLEALTLIKKAEKAKADLIEVRLDSLETSRNLSELVKSTKIPLIATNKHTNEKGLFTGTETERQRILLNAAENGFEYVDVNLSSSKNQETIDKLKQSGAKAIVSYHKFDDALSVFDMEKVLEQEIATGASVCKIIGTANKIEDNIAVLNFVASHSSKARLVCFCMGEAGKVSRLLSTMFGAFFTFASLGQGEETAEGQMTICEMQAAYDLLGA
jgi:3-dehydroquinate dehydratase type I